MKSILIIEDNEDIRELERETLMRHKAAYPEIPVEDDDDLEVGGQYQWRARGERHMFNPDTIHKLQHSCRTGDYGLYKEFAKLIDENGNAPITLRHLLSHTSGIDDGPGYSFPAGTSLRATSPAALRRSSS